MILLQEKDGEKGGEKEGEKEGEKKEEDTKPVIIREDITMGTTVIDLPDPSEEDIKISKKRYVLFVVCHWNLILYMIYFIVGVIYRIYRKDSRTPPPQIPISKLGVR